MTDDTQRLTDDDKYELSELITVDPNGTVVHDSRCSRHIRSPERLNQLIDIVSCEIIDWGDGVETIDWPAVWREFESSEDPLSNQP